VVVGAVCYGEVILMWHCDWSQVATSREVLSGRKDLLEDFRAELEPRARVWLWGPCATAK